MPGSASSPDLERGRSALAAGDHVAALNALERARLDGRARGDPALELRAWSIAIVAAARGGMALDGLDLAERRRPEGELLPAQRAQAEYFRAMALREAARFPEAVAALNRCLALGAAPQIARDARHMLGTTWIQLGETERGREVLRALLESAEDAAERVEIRNNIAWAHLSDAEAGSMSPGQTSRARPLLLEAWAEERGLELDADRRAHLQVNLALDAAQHGHFEDARRWLVRSTTTSSAARVHVWQLEVGARIALGAGSCAEAEASAMRLLRFGERRLSAGAQWQGWTARARAARRCRTPQDAALAYAEAERALTRLALDIPDEIGLLPFLHARRRSAREWIALELGRGRPEAAHQIARRAIQRVHLSRLHDARLSALPEPVLQRTRELFHQFQALRQRMARTSGEAEQAALSDRAGALLAEARGLLASTATRALDAPLRAPGEEELFVTWFAQDQGYLAFTGDQRGTAAIELGPLPEDPGARPSWALAKLDPALRRHRRLRFLTEPPVSHLDLARYLLDGAPLASRHLVTQAFELPRALSGAPADADGVVVGVSLSPGLPALAGVAGEVDAACPVPPTRCVRLLEGGSRHGEAATRARLVEHLPRAGWLHFAGHGVFDELDGWSSALLLHGQDRLEVNDVLTLERAPPFVYLSACKTGSLAEGAEGGSIGLAMAFILAGADGVFAPVRDVPDSAAAVLAKRVHAARAQGMAWLPAAMSAQTGLADQAGVWAFRYFEP